MTVGNYEKFLASCAFGVGVKLNDDLAIIKEFYLEFSIDVFANVAVILSLALHGLPMVG